MRRSDGVEQGLCEPTKSGSGTVHSDGGIPQITFKPVDVYKDIVPLCPLLWEYWSIVNQEDLSEWEDVEIHPGIVAPYQKVEMMAYTLAQHGAKFLGAYEGETLVGFMCYRLAYNVVLLVDHFFVLPEYQDKGIGKGLIGALPEGVKKVYFWTRKNNPPKTLEVQKHSVPIFEDDKHITWEMTWVGLQ